MRLSVQIAKRAIDIAASSVGLAIAAPLFPVLGAAIYLDSPGPIFYRQRRAGRLLEARGNEFKFREFDMYKFRSMCVNAEKNTGVTIAGQNDSRVTRVGRFLRKSRLDELPQLWNVFTGSMSLVGPRPERPELINDLALAIPLFEERMRDVKPGITGLSQVSLGYSGAPLPGSAAEGHSQTLSNPFGLDEAEGALADEMRMKLLYDMAYTASLERLSTYLAMEFNVIIKTPMVMLGGIGR